MAAGKILDYVEGRSSVPEAIRERVAINENPAGLTWATIIPATMDVSSSKLPEIYRSGKGLDWNHRDPHLWKGTCNFFKPLYQGMLTSSLPTQVKEVLEKEGARLADIGCGQGFSTYLFAEAFPKATVKGIDYCSHSIAAAKDLANERNVSNVSFSKESAADFSLEDGAFDVTCFLYCFHNMSVAKTAANRTPQATKPGGYCFLIEAMGAEQDKIEDQLAYPTTVMFGGLSCHVCLCCSKTNNGDALGTICPTDVHREIFKAAGYKSCDAVESPVNAAWFRFILAQK